MICILGRQWACFIDSDLCSLLLKCLVHSWCLRDFSLTCFFIPLFVVYDYCKSRQNFLYLLCIIVASPGKRTLGCGFG